MPSTQIVGMEVDSDIDVLYQDFQEPPADCYIMTLAKQTDTGSHLINGFSTIPIDIPLTFDADVPRSGWVAIYCAIGLANPNDTSSTDVPDSSWLETGNGMIFRGSTNYNGSSARWNDLYAGQVAYKHVSAGDIHAGDVLDIQYDVGGFGAPFTTDWASVYLAVLIDDTMVDMSGGRGVSDGHNYSVDAGTYGGNATSTDLTWMTDFGSLDSALADFALFALAVSTPAEVYTPSGAMSVMDSVFGNDIGLTAYKNCFVPAGQEIEPGGTFANPILQASVETQWVSPA